MDSGSTGKPVFGFLHLFEPHTPYAPPEPHNRRYPPPYDGEVARADEIVGSFLEGLKAGDLYDRSVILFFRTMAKGCAITARRSTAFFSTGRPSTSP